MVQLSITCDSSRKALEAKKVFMLYIKTAHRALEQQSIVA
jgi:hypothetical protein